jgi:hypothetical protein
MKGRPWREGSLPREHFENQEKIDPESLREYEGNYVAWSWDGSTIVDFAPTDEELWAKLRAAGHDVQRVVFQWIDVAE